MAKKRSNLLFAFVLVLGLIVGSAVGKAIGLILPEGVVKGFFLASGGFTLGPTVISLAVLEFTLGMSLDINVMSGLGAILAAYLYRWY